MKLSEFSLNDIVEPDVKWQEKAQAYLDSLAMPPGALGMLGHTAVKLATIQKTLKPQIKGKSLVMACADHGVVAEGVSNYPQITHAIVNTALTGGAAINAFCNQAGVNLTVLNVGVKGDVKPPEPMNAMVHYISKPVAPGTANMLHQPAMTKEECTEAISIGIQLAQDLDANIFVLGEMGIGNTTSASCLLAKYCDLSAEQVTGPGTGVKGEALQHKKEVIRKILERCSTEQEPFEILLQVGGLEIAALVGVILGAASQQKAVVLDGFISGAAALAAKAIAPSSMSYLFAGHQSAEPAHKQMLESLGLEPLVKLDLRLGEGTGAALATNFLEASCNFFNSMLTLDEALKLS